MPEKTPIYKLERFRRGSYYSATSDFHRFTTLDYNMESYVGVVGVGIISGWDLEHVSDLEIQIIPGNGIIDGYFAESPYTVKQRSDMVAGDREVEVFDQNEVEEPNLTPSQRAIYVSVIQLYDPSFNPVGDIVNDYVKVSVPSTLIVNDDTDNFIFAKFKDYPTHQPYPSLDDLSILIANLGEPPIRGDYSNWNSYKAALDIYNVKLAIIQAYKWSDNPNNRWTEVEFEIQPRLVYDSKKVYLGKVVARDGTVSSIDVSGVESLEGLRSQIERFANEYIVNHHHGGSSPYDPPKVKLETDIRNCVLGRYVQTTGQAIYDVLNSDETSITLGHKHTYRVDSNGDGYTMEQIGGNVGPHFHTISSLIIKNPQQNPLNVENHIHTISIDEDKVWDSSSRYIIYVDDAEFGDETSEIVTADSTTQQVTFQKGISITQNSYSGSFEIWGKTYSYADKSYNAFQFMTAFANDFVSSYSEKFNEIYVALEEESVIWDRSVDDPFWQWEQLLSGTSSQRSFTFEDGTTVQITVYPSANNQNVSVKGFSGLREQSPISDVLLSNAGDQFIFTPPAAHNITITLVEKGESDKVELEILGNTEVTGTLRSESIFYIKANKILTGQFDIERIPFISHIGRLQEDFLPFKYSLQSNDGYRYAVTPSLTDITLSHNHRMVLDKDGSGVTTDTLVGGEVVFYQTDENGDSVLVSHYHPVNQLDIGTVEQNGLSVWLNGNNTSSTSHTHNVISPVRGNGKTVYSVVEDIDGNLYAGTSDGFMMIPALPSYLFVINGYNYHVFGNDLWTAFIEAKNLYEKETELLFETSTSVYGSQITDAEDELQDDGDSVILLGFPYPNKPQDETLIVKESSFRLPNFKYIRDSRPQDVLDDETIIATKTVLISTGEEVDISDLTDEEKLLTEEIVVVERDFNDVPIWSNAIKTVVTPGETYITSTSQTDYLVVGSNLIAKCSNINNDPNLLWSSVEIPFQVGIARKIIRSYDGAYWVATNNGILVSRSYNEGNDFEIASLPGGNPDIKDIIEGETGSIYTASEAGIFKTLDKGKTWNKVLDTIGGFSQISRDYSLDKSTIVDGHYHNSSSNSQGNGFLEESIGTGTKHVHQIIDWVVQDTMGHTHTLIVTIFALDNSKILWKSIDNGLTWSNYGSIPYGEYGAFIAAFGKIMVSLSDGIYVTSNGSSWTRALEGPFYTYDWDYDLLRVFIGGNNAIYETLDGSDFEIVYQFSGNPLVVITENDTRKYFGYAYSNLAFTIHLKEPLQSINDTFALVDFGKWFANNGSWSSSSPYDIYVDYRRVLSTKFDEDRREELGYSFEVSPEDGMIDFSASSNVTSEVTAGDLTLSVGDSTGFQAQDAILIESNFEPGGPPSQGSSQSDASYQQELNTYFRSLQSIETTATYATISSISGNTLTLTSRLPRDINLPSTVSKIPNLNGDSSVKVSIYESVLDNIGTLTHDQLEDGLSNYSDGRPYKFNDSYLSNLLQLTQAVRYVYPTINSEFKNALFYDFRYKSSTNPTYPDITDYIDVLTSNIYSQKLYDTDFSRVFATSINKILVGYGNFVGNLIVATDLGIFWQKIETNMEANWFFVPDFTFPVYDILIFGDKIIAATANGAYSSYDMETWQEEAPLFSNISAYSLGLRWKNESSIVVGSHSANFVSELDSSDDDGRGILTASSGHPYDVLTVGQGIKITGASEKNGDYIIQSIGDDGAGYGSQLTVSRVFPGSDTTKTGVVITQASWWNQWNGDANTFNSDLTNTMLIGGRGRVAYSVNNEGTDFTWAEALVPTTNFIAKQFYTLSNGLVLMSAPGTTLSSSKNNLLSSSNVGQSWDVFKSFEAVKAQILSSRITEQNNTRIAVSYSYPVDFQYVDGALANKEFAIVSSTDEASTVYRGLVVSNEKRNGIDYITLFGNEAANYVDKTRIIVYPVKITSAIETADKSIFFGTDDGIYWDENTIVNNSKIEGTVRSSSYSGIIQSIDINGEIISFSSNALNNTVTVSVTSDRIIREGSLTGKVFNIIDADPVEKYNILSSKSDGVTGEVLIVLSGSFNTGVTAATYNGKKFTITGEVSRLYVNFDLPVVVNQFVNGTLYVTSNEADNLGDTYVISSNGLDYIDLNTVISPTSTFSTSSEVAILKSGQSFSLVDSTGQITLWVLFDRKITENALRGLEVRYQNSIEDEEDSTIRIVSSIDNIGIVSSTENSITFDADDVSDQLQVIRSQALTAGVSESQLNTLAPVFLFQPGDLIELEGSIVERLPGFANKRTSLDLDHYHTVETVGEFVSGTISSFGTHNASYVRFFVSDTQNFSNPLIQIDGSLLKDAKIIFTNEDSYNLRYESDVVENDATSITVRIKSQSFWNFDASDRLAISEGWNWQIDARAYGYTDEIIYDDFTVKSTAITEQLDRGETTVKLENTSGIVVGDRIRLQDDTLSFEINSVATIVDIQTITISNPASRTYYATRNPQARILNNNFSNAHVHQIRANEVELLNIPEYLNLGYPSSHAHTVLALIPKVNQMLNRNNEIIVMGSDPRIYSSTNNGLTWTEIADLNNFTEGDVSVEGIFSGILRNDGIIAGATNGRVFVEGTANGDVVSLAAPEIT